MPIVNKKELLIQFEKDLRKQISKDSNKLITKFEEIHALQIENLGLVDSGWLANQSFVDFDKDRTVFGFRTPPNFKSFDPRRAGTGNYGIFATRGIGNFARHGKRTYNMFTAFAARGYLKTGEIRTISMPGGKPKRFPVPIFGYK